VDENIDGYAEYLSRFVFSPAWGDFSLQLGICIVKFEQIGLAKGTPDDQVWEFCQQQHIYLITDNRNQNDANSLQNIIRTRNQPTSLPVFTISDVNRFRFEREYVESVVVKLLEYLVDADIILGTGRLYLP
jgi:hypothetical protein